MMRIAVSVTGKDLQESLLTKKTLWGFETVGLWPQWNQSLGGTGF
ncbi:MAG: hypothetical protein ACLQHF_18370 [Terracidiphilus sp.]